MFNRFFVVLFVSVLFSHVANANNVDVWVENKQVPYGEIFNLNISYEGNDGNSLQPDLGVLQNDFTIYSTSSSIQSSYINGQSNQRREWDIGLMPKREGKIIIPEIKVGKYKTKSLEIEVLPTGSDVDNSLQKNKNDYVNDAFAVELQIDNNAPYVQQEINAILTIKDNRGLELTSEPYFINADNWIIKSLGRPSVYNDGKGHRELKFYYALFPQKSGKQFVPSVNVDGYYVSFDSQNPVQRQKMGFFQIFDMDIDSMFGIKRPVALQSKPIEINVKPVINGYNYTWWLPANALNVVAKWSDEKPVFKVGETVAREIILNASGVLDTQLPDLELKENEYIKQYPDKPIVSSSVNDGKVVSKAVYRIVYIPQKNGEQIIHEIRIPWFNVVTQKIEEAIVPAEKIVVIGESGIIENSENMEENLVKSVETKDVEIQKSLPSENANKKIIFSILGAFLLGILLSLVVFMIFIKKRETKDVEISLTKIRNNIKHSDYRALRDNLLQWANYTFKNVSINNLNDLADFIGNKDFLEQMQIINNNLYANGSGMLNAEIILSNLKQSKKKVKDIVKKEPLPRLYK